MSSASDATPERQHATTRSPIHFAAGRCVAAIMFSLFGVVWLALGLFALGVLHWPAVLLLGAAAAFIVALALRLLTGMKAAIAREPPHPRQKQDDRTFAWINAAQGVVIFLLFAILPRLGYQDLAVAAAVLVVGLHFLFMPPLYRSRSNLVLGISMTVWGLLCLIVFHGDHRIAFAALGAGVLLLPGAAWALYTASTVRRSILTAPSSDP